MTEQLAQEVFRTASESIDVLSPPVEGAIGQARGMRRKRRRVVAGAVAAAVVVVAGATWATTRPDDVRPPEPSPANVISSPNPTAIAWYAGGELHLEHIAVELPPLTDLVEVYGGAVYGDREGAVAYIAADGTRTVIGEKAAAEPLVGSDVSGWAAWVDPRGETPALVVYDVVGGKVLDRLELPSSDPDSHPVAIDQNHVFYVTHEGDFAWTPHDEEPARLDRQGLLDSSSATRVYGASGQVDMVQSFFSVHFVRRGEGAMLSAGGNYVLTRAPGAWTPGAPFRPLLYDARSGDRLVSGVAPDELVLDASFGEEHDVIYIVGRAADLDVAAGGSEDLQMRLRSCQIGTADCHDEALLPQAGERPLLAH
ncbi:MULTISPECIES: hypothetical protein [unclassified Nocardioides]|uniref:hypothetical protein n=1 Tax=unclassified Nocardioides TaxID=2615069 RepID=UPI0009F11875|nr:MULTISPECIES: hypothetical protein [unclassified Nocardioides]GAW49337.1 uncharacterized protein PD653B2_1659 [Nocardioides sp. PD653-B2]GAW55149.1 uncharacterized protein PD653_2568 [Nocardioides sp. PD653]